jgi:rod shape-determining protein MreD
MSARPRPWPLWLILLGLVVAHFYLRPRMYAGRAAPDFLVLGLLIVALRSRPGTAAVAGLLTGLLVDVLSPADFGSGMLAHTGVAYVAAWGRAIFFAENLLVAGGVFAAGTWLRNLIVLLAGGGPVEGFLAAVTLWSVAQAVLTALAGVIVLLLIRDRVDFRLET